MKAPKTCARKLKNKGAIITVKNSRNRVVYTDVQKWSKKVEFSTYGPYEGENTTATGKKITNSTKYIAVPMQMIVSKSHWNKLSAKNKMSHFYYHEKLILKRGAHKVKVLVEDCGGFYGFGTSSTPRYFDCTPAVFNALGSGKGTGTVRFCLA